MPATQLDNYPVSVTNLTSPQLLKISKTTNSPTTYHPNNTNPYTEETNSKFRLYVILNPSLYIIRMPSIISLLTSYLHL